MQFFFVSMAESREKLDLFNILLLTFMVETGDLSANFFFVI